jgi:hypothetical protein
MKTATDLYFKYPDTARIRIKKSNVLMAPEWPAVYGIVTKRLSFVIPKVAVVFTEKHAYIPLSIYREVLNKYYLSINKVS